MTTTPDALQLVDVRFTYPDHSLAALDGVSLSVAQGEMVAIMGPSGAGKSTLAKVINRTIPAFHPGVLTGHIAILGEPMLDQGVADLAGVVGVVAQDFEAQLFSTNVEQEVAFGLEQRGVPTAEIRSRTREALATVGLEGFGHRDPTTLSGGEKQRLAIAASLALSPAILVFDEPTTDLDPAGKDEVLAVIGDLRRRGTTLVVIEHEIRAAEIADRLILLDHGRVVAEGPSRVLLDEANLLARYAVRAPELALVAAGLGIQPAPRSIADAARTITSRHSAALQRAVAAAPAARSNVAPVLEVDDVHFAYPNGKEVLAGISLTIRPGELVALLGRNGSGKTTLAKHLNGLLTPSAGHVRLDGDDVGSLAPARVAARVGYVFQNPDLQIFADSVRDEVRFGPINLGLDEAEITVRVTAALAAVGLESVADEDPFILSKGERQRLAIASLLALRPEVLILDEPTTGLDYREQRRVMELLRRLHGEGMAILVITHTPWIVAEYAERAIVVSAGEIAYDGGVAAMLRRDDLLAAAHFVAPDSSLLAQRLGIEAHDVPGIISACGGSATEVQ